MSRIETALKLVLIVSLILSTGATGASAQTPTRHLLFDTESTEVATVHTNGKAFVVYSQQNLLPYASGIEVYTDGNRVTAPGTVDEVFQALARRKATKFQPEAQTIARLHRVVNLS